MMISAAPFDGTSNELCDWMELAALASSDGRVLLGEVNLGLEMEEDFEDEDLAQEDQTREQRVQMVLAAMDERRKAMSTAYPFECSESSSHVVLKPGISNGGSVYLFCLIVSNAARNGLLHGHGDWEPDLEKARGLFQACATVCSSGYVRGPAYSVGWPRPDSSSFVGKLKQVYERFNDGKPHPTVPQWAPKRVKDDEIDVIAFKHERDGQGGTLYLLAQAASGKDWAEKSVKTAVETYHKTWFHQIPASPPIPAIAMPFWMPSQADNFDFDHEEQEVIAGKYWRTSTEMGVVLYRSRIAHCVDEAVALSKTGVEPIEQLEALPTVRAYVEKYREQLQTAVKALE
jgi:hypothetical protein